LAFHPKFNFRLYIAEEDKIISIPTYSEPDTIKIADLPAGGSHRSRTIGFGPDGMLYAAIGSTCNVCHETDERRAAILRGGSDGRDLKVWARGLRNTVFFTWREDGKMFGADMGRDFLGDDLPPDEINILREGNFGWPICYGKNIHDGEFDKNVYIRDPCMEPFEIGSYIDIPAHSAPLGLAFIPKNSRWPREYWGDLLVAYHGSWNRSVPTGYKVVRYEFDDRGEYAGKVSDFVTGFLTDSGAVLGRPVDINVSLDGFAYISDDYAGIIYKVLRRP
jgi:glucose/arabinose dehydrogenase